MPQLRRAPRTRSGVLLTVRGNTHRSRLIRSLLDIRLSRFSLAVLATVSVAATVVIVTNGSGHTAAQLTALAALRESPSATPQTVGAAPLTAATSSSPGSGDAGSSGSGSGGSAGSSSSASDFGSTGADTGSTSGDSNAGTATGARGAGGDGGDDSTTPATTATPASNLPKVSHVFEIVAGVVLSSP